MDVYAIPNFGSKPIQEVSLTNLQAVLNIYALMGNTADWYLIAKFRSIYEYVIRPVLLKSKQYFNNAFRTAVNYDDLMTLKKVLKE